MANQITVKKTTFNVGDTIAVQQKIKEGDKTRLQTFQGVVISIKGRGDNKMFTVRRIASAGVGVERIWPVNSPWLEKIIVKKRGQVRRAKLYYLRQRLGKKATRIRTKSLPLQERPACQRLERKRLAGRNPIDAPGKKSTANEKQTSRRRPAKD